MPGPGIYSDDALSEWLRNRNPKRIIKKDDRVRIKATSEVGQVLAANDLLIVVRLRGHMLPGEYRSEELEFLLKGDDGT